MASGKKEIKRICIIGAGPSGMSTLYYFDKMQRKGIKVWMANLISKSFETVISTVSSL